VTKYFPRLVVFDRKGDWKNETVNARARNFNEFSSAYRSLHNSPEFTIVVEFSRGSSDEELIETSDRIVNLLFNVETSKTPRAGLGIVYEEVWLYCSPYFSPVWLSEIVLTGRSERISFIGNAQRPASVHKNIPSQCDHIFIGQLQDPNDARYFREIVGDIPELRHNLPKYEFLWHRPGENPLKVKTKPI
jgi:DNA helicase HerA-like ATPase